MGVIENALERFDIPEEALGACRVILSGQQFASLENHRGLLEYSPETLLLSRRNGVVRVRGEALEIVAMDKRSIVIKGKIFGVDME